MDFEGRSDGGSVKKILSHVSPLKLVRTSFVLFDITKFVFTSPYSVKLLFSRLRTYGSIDYYIYSCQYSVYTWHVAMS